MSLKVELTFCFEAEFLIVTAGSHLMAEGTEIGAVGLGSVSMGSVTGLVELRVAAGTAGSETCSVVLMGLALGFALGDRCTEELDIDSFVYMQRF